jgi:outer membrane protein assembly factor BamB
VIKLNRRYDQATGLVQVAPEITFTDEAWDEQVINDNAGDQHASVESSVTVLDDVAYFGTSAGLVLGYDLSGLEDGQPPEQVFRFYTAGDNDATLVADDEGFLYAAAQNDRPEHPRARQVGQLQKLDPSKPTDPIVWSFQETSSKGAGLYGTPAVLDDVVIITSAAGRLIALDRDTGAVLWERTLGGAAWASPVVVDDVLLIGDCEGQTFHAYDLANPRVAPPELWSVDLGGCIEATPAVWKGRIYIGSRAGKLTVLE